MYRCASTLLRPAALAWALMMVLLGGAHAQAARNFPANALRGEITFGVPPAITLNGQATQLAPGARIRTEANVFVLTGEVQGLTRVMLYTMDLYGQPLLVWLLTPAERAKRWPSTAAEAATWTFDAATQTWTQP